MKPAGISYPKGSGRVVTLKWVCKCSPNEVFKSVAGICPKCDAFCELAEVAQAKAQADLSPKTKAPTKVYDDYGKDITPKVEAKRSFTYTERDHADNQRLNDLKTKK